MNTYKTVPFDVQIPNLEGDGVAETISIDVQVYLDAETGEEVLTPESLQLIEKTQARHMGLISAGEIKQLRERLQLTQKQMSELIQAGEKSYTRWERGRARPSRSINVLLCALRDGRIDVNYLRSLGDPDHVWADLSESNPQVQSYKQVIVIYGNATCRAVSSQAGLFGGREPAIDAPWAHLLSPDQNSEENLWNAPTLTTSRIQFDFEAPASS